MATDKFQIDTISAANPPQSLAACSSPFRGRLGGGFTVFSISIGQFVSDSIFHQQENVFTDVGDAGLQNLQHEHTTSAASFGFSKYINFGSGTPAKARNTQHRRLLLDLVDILILEVEHKQRQGWKV